MHLVSNFVRQAVREIFATMLTVEVVSSEEVPDEVEPPVNLDGVTGQVSLTGKFSGAIYLNLPEKFATTCAANILGSTPETTALGDINDVVGELTNMVTGSLKSKMTDRGFNCQLSVPSVLRGHDLAVDSSHVTIKLYNEFKANNGNDTVKVYVFARLEE